MTSHYQNEVARSPLFRLIDQLANFEDVAKSDVLMLKAMVLNTANTIGPHLDRVRQTFTQYTEHDLRHATNVADNIHRLLPAKYEQEPYPLNALELTLLWLSVLLHDAGMFVSDATEKQELIDSNSYFQFRERHHRRAREARLLRSAGKSVSADALDDSIFADFIRQNHGLRINKYIETNLSSELTFREVSLVRMVCQLCESHTWSVRTPLNLSEPDKKVEALSKRELVGRTPVNLCYLACCLRLGDILDYDRTRTPMSAFTAIAFSEQTSVQEWQKHRCIEGIEIQPHAITYSARCQTPETLHAVHTFLDLIDRELREVHATITNFSSRDSRRYRLEIPTSVDRDQICMADPSYHTGTVRFALSFDEITRLLMDKSLYPDRSLFLRELLQNSLDACRLQYARASQAQMADKYSPRIQVWDNSHKPSPHIIFQDNGIGISLDQFEKFFARLGKSYYKSSDFYEERRRLQDSGETIDTCSQFGIGFLSCFLVADHITIETRSDNDTPLQISIDGPQRYFLIKKLAYSQNETVLFNSPKNLLEDRPPHTTGTRITVSLEKDWPDLETSGDVVFETLNAFAANQDFPIYIYGSTKEGCRRIDAERWERRERKVAFPKWWPPSSEIRAIDSSYFTPSMFGFSAHSSSLRGGGGIWMMSSNGKPTPRMGYVQSYGPGTRSHTGVFDNSLIRYTKYLLGLSKNKKVHEKLRGSLLSIANASRDRPIAASTLPGGYYEFRHDENGQTFGPDELAWILEVLQVAPEPKPLLMQFSSTQWNEEVGALLKGSKEDLLDLWKRDGYGQKLDVEFDSQYRLALHGIETPGGFQSWDPAAGTARRHNWLPGGTTLLIDMVGFDTPTPAASRLFVPYDRSEVVRSEISRACLRHAIGLWKTNREIEDWSEWFAHFLASWSVEDLDSALTTKQWQELLGQSLDVKEPSRVPGVITRIIATTHSKLGEAIYRGTMGRLSPEWLDPRNPISSETILEAASRLKIPAAEVSGEVSSLSEQLGWAIDRGYSTK